MNMIMHAAVYTARGTAAITPHVPASDGSDDSGSYSGPPAPPAAPIQVGPMRPWFVGYQPGLSAPGYQRWRVDAATGGTAPFVGRFFMASATGQIVVDTPEQTEVPVLVQQGLNPLRISRVYAPGSDAIIVDVWV